MNVVGMFCIPLHTLHGIHQLRVCFRLLKIIIINQNIDDAFAIDLKVNAFYKHSWSLNAYAMVEFFQHNSSNEK